MHSTLVREPLQSQRDEPGERVHDAVPWPATCIDRAA